MPLTEHSTSQFQGQNKVARNHSRPLEGWGQSSEPDQKISTPLATIVGLAGYRYHRDRVDRVLGFYSSRPNRDPPTRRRAFPLPLWFRWGTHLLAKEGVGGSQLGRGDRYCGTLSFHLLIILQNFQAHPSPNLKTPSLR